jgi:hypothetical protein
MAQIARAQIVNTQQELPITTTALVNGLTINMLTGAGSILIYLIANIFDVSHAGNFVVIKPVIDNIIIDSPGPTVSLAADGYVLFNYLWLARPGAGQHKFEIYAHTTPGLADFFQKNGYLIVHEPGY